MNGKFDSWLFAGGVKNVSGKVGTRLVEKRFLGISTFSGTEAAATCFGFKRLNPFPN